MFSASPGASRYVWDFGDGGQAVTAAPTVAHTYDREGAFHVVVTAQLPGEPPRGAFTEVRVGDVHDDIVRDSPVWIPTTVPTLGGVGPPAELRGGVTRPDAPGRFPVIVEYTAYRAGSLTTSNPANVLVRSGYAVVRVSAPGTNSSDGQFDMFGPEARQAGVDVVEWAASQPWSNGRVALVGVSAPGILALLTASANPDGLVAVGADAAYADLYRDQVYRGGIPSSNTFVNVWRAGLGGVDTAQALSDGQPGQLPDKLAGTATDLAEMAARPLYDDWWRERTITELPEPDAAVLLYATTGDLWPRSFPELAAWIAPAGGKVTVAPGFHGAQDPSGFLPANFLCREEPCEGGNIEVDMVWRVGEMRRWLDEHLAGLDTSASDRPLFTAYVPRGGQPAALSRDDGEWVRFDEWPLDGTEWTRLHLRPGDPGELTAAPPEDETATLPASPLTGIGLGPEVEDAGRLVYETGPLPGDLRLIGPGTLTLYATVEGADFPFTVTVADVAPDGSTAHVAKGWLQATHRAVDPERSWYTPDGELARPYHPHDSVEPLELGAVHRFDIELEPIVNTFRAGHRLQIRIAAQDLSQPLAWSATVPPAANATVHHGGDHASSVLLPIAPVTATDHAPFPLERP